MNINLLHVSKINPFNFKSEKVVNKYNLCDIINIPIQKKVFKDEILETIENNKSINKSSMSNKEISKFYKSSFFDSSKENIIKNSLINKNQKNKYKESLIFNPNINLKYSKTNLNNYNINIIFAEDINNNEFKLTKKISLRDNIDSCKKFLDLKIFEKKNETDGINLQNDNLIKKKSSETKLINENENKKTFSFNLYHTENRKESDKNIMNIFESEQKNCLINEFVKIPINESKYKILSTQNNTKRINQLAIRCRRDSQSSKNIQNYQHDIRSKRDSFSSKNVLTHNNHLDPTTYYSSDSTNRIMTKKNYMFPNINKNINNYAISNDQDNLNQQQANILELRKNNLINENDKYIFPYRNTKTIVNQYRFKGNRKIKQENKEKRNFEKNRDEEIDNLISESKTRIILTESITRKVIILILSLVIVLPILNEDIYRSDEIESYNILAEYIANYKAIFPDKFDSIIPSFIINEVDENYPIINITNSNGNLIFQNDTLKDFHFRITEINSVFSNEGEVIILYSVLYENKFSAMLSIFKTLFVCLCLLTAAVYFEKDTKKLVLDPLEIMIEVVEFVAKDPIKAKDLDNLNLGAKSTLWQWQIFDEKKIKKYQKQKEKSEVKIILSAIKKISALLAIGLGEAGNEIIKENLSNYNDLNPMIKGRKKKAIFGFCDIRDFPTVNEALQENTVVFLNQIADIVHSSVDLFFGATNKNIGDAFLTVWKIPTKNQNNENLNFKKQQTNSNKMLDYNENNKKDISKSYSNKKNVKNLNLKFSDERSIKNEELNNNKNTEFNYNEINYFFKNREDSKDINEKENLKLIGIY